MANMMNINTGLNILTIVVLGLMWFGAVGAHVDDNSIHTDYQEQAQNFMPRQELELIVTNLTDQIDRLELAIDRMDR